MNMAQMEMIGQKMMNMFFIELQHKNLGLQDGTQVQILIGSHQLKPNKILMLLTLMQENYLVIQYLPIVTIVIHYLPIVLTHKHGRKDLMKNQVSGFLFGLDGMHLISMKI